MRIIFLALACLILTHGQEVKISAQVIDNNSSLKDIDAEENIPKIEENVEIEMFRRPPNPPPPRPPNSASVLFSNGLVAFIFSIIFVGILIRN
ncbi:hypothetical protein ACKWTF_006858 [Chironomus riparius]